MEFIISDQDGMEVDILKERQYIDMDCGGDNDFEIQISRKLYKSLGINEGWRIGVPGTEYGGIIHKIKNSSSTNKVTLSGPTWRGLLTKKIIEPDPGEDYKIVSGEANTIINNLSCIEFDGIFSCTGTSGIMINNYHFDRYISHLDGLEKMLRFQNARLNIAYDSGEPNKASYVKLSAVPIEDYSDEIEYSRDGTLSYLTFEFERYTGGINHLICLGKGDLKDRLVIHLYVQKDGSIGSEKYYTGKDERVDVYDYPNAESAADLQEKGIERLKKLMSYTNMDMDLVNRSLSGIRGVTDNIDIGDIVGGRDFDTGIYLSKQITRKIIRVKNGKESIEYSVGKNTLNRSTATAPVEPEDAYQKQIDALKGDLPYVTLESFGGAGDGETINDDAFIEAMKSGYNIALHGGKIYKFSGNYIDLGNYGRRVTIKGNNAIVKNLSFKWNINESNNRVVNSAVDEFPISFEDIKFADNVRPIILTASNVDVKRCNFSGCKYCFAFPEYYIDYFHMSDCYFYSTTNVVSTFDYDGTEKEYGVYGDWFVFERCHFSFDEGAKVFANSPNHAGSVYFINCLHGIYTINNSAYYRYRFIFKGHHFEKGIIINNTPTIPIPQGFVKISDSYMYSTSFPDVVDGITLDNVEINYGNSGNYKVIECERGKYIRKFAESMIEFDEFEFKHGDKPPKPITPDTSSNYYTSGTMNSKSYQKYDSVHRFRYAIATSLEKDRLWFNGQTKTIYFSSEFSNTANRTCACSIYTNCYVYLKNVYVHIFKYMDDVLYRCVIPITQYLKSDATVSSNGLFQFYDEPEGVFGCPWIEYDGAVAYET